ncbi:MAG: hypothetical protein WCY34_02850 [Candidatus Omnitrophota bacterium]
MASTISSRGYGRRLWNEDRYYAVLDRVLDAWESVAGDAYELGGVLETAITPMPSYGDPAWYGDRDAVRAARAGILKARRTILALDGGSELLDLEQAMRGR